MKPLTQTLSASIVAITALAASLSITTPTQAQQMVQAQGGPICGSRTSLLGQLQGKYSEMPKSMGLAANGSVLEILTAISGTWTILLTTPGGITCLIAAGEHWEEMEQKKADYTPS